MKNTLKLILMASILTSSGYSMNCLFCSVPTISEMNIHMANNENNEEIKKKKKKGKKLKGKAGKGKKGGAWGKWKSKWKKKKAG